jgi:hypothetical protein
LIEVFFVISLYNDTNVSTVKEAKLIFGLDKKEGFVRYTCTGKLKTENILKSLLRFKLPTEQFTEKCGVVSIEFTAQDNTECKTYEITFFLLPHNSSTGSKSRLERTVGVGVGGVGTGKSAGSDDRGVWFDYSAGIIKFFQRFRRFGAAATRD